MFKWFNKNLGLILYQFVEARPEFEQEVRLTHCRVPDKKFKFIYLFIMYTDKFFCHAHATNCTTSKCMGIFQCWKISSARGIITN